MILQVRDFTLPAAFGGIISGAVERLSRLTTPRHVTPIGAAQVMVGQKSILPPVHSRSAHGVALYERTCPVCGTVSIVAKRRLGLSCYPCAMKIPRAKTHGMAIGGRLHPVYRLFLGIVIRCEHPSTNSYKDYGGRGIRVCLEWRHDPGRFVEWATTHGWQPGLQIDRIDTDGDYSPTNCRFVTAQINAQNRRDNKLTPEQASAIKRLRNSGKRARECAESFGVSRRLVSSIWRGEAWSNVP